MALWSSWGALPQIFDEHNPQWADERQQLRALLDPDAYTAARRTTINAHYTDPAIAALMWQTAQRLGFQGGQVLEPGAGSGTFLSHAPAGAEVTAVELDPTSARVCALRFPQATVRAESFAASPFADGSFDLAIGNVPFADVRLYDPRHNPANLTLHNHFLVKSLALTRPGGLVIALSSRYTLDARNPAARRALYELGDLVGAVRLPSGTHRRTAGTEAITDLLILRRRPADEPSRADTWLRTTDLEIGDQTAPVNRYFVDEPGRVLGRLRLGRGMYGPGEVLVDPDPDLDAMPGQLSEQLDAIVAAAAREGLGITPGRSSGPAHAVEAQRAPRARAQRWSGHLTAQADGSFTVLIDGAERPLDVARTQRVELRALLALRDQARALLDHEAADAADSPRLAGMRSGLHDAYTRYVARYGAINRYRLRPTGRPDPNTGEPGMARSQPPAVALLRRDPFGPLVLALERFDDSTQQATPAQLLFERALKPPVPRTGADTPADALAICLDQLGHVDLDHIAQLLGRSPEEARGELGELVYHDPDQEQLVVAAEYLSGDVRSKLDTARVAAEHDPDLQVNVTALEGVLPEPLGPEDLEATLGAAWIDSDTHQQFLRELLDDASVIVEHAPSTGMWAVKGHSQSILAREQWGTSRMSAIVVARHCLEQLPIRITDEIDDGQSTRRVLNPVETTAAQEKAALMQERFSEWVWEDPERTTRLLEAYNRRFNSLVLRDYTQAGRLMALPGLAGSFAPREHQRAAVARMLAEPTVGLFHQVGAGKTAAMVIAAMEMRRLGLVSKPCVVVPNHMLEQFSREWLQLYPRARVLVTSTRDLAGDGRRTFVARAAADDWDAIVMTQTAFERIGVSTETEHAYIARQVTDVRAALEVSERGSGLTVKRLERAAIRLEEQLARLRDHPSDPGLCFEQTGIDYLIVDEAHAYKNLQTMSNIPSASIEGSKRATDLQIKLDLLRQQHGGRVGTLATATPIANSITEAHVMCRYLRPDLLEAAGILHFDAWAATFGKTVTELELAPTGGGNYRMATRFARFQNVPEMLRIFRVFADVKTAEDLALPTPRIAARSSDGAHAPETVVIAPSPELEDFLHQLADRAENVRGGSVDPTEDNMLLITGDGRKAALDMRLVADGQPASGIVKLDVAAERIAGIYHANHDRSYLADDGSPSPTPGALQIVFCDLSTPTRDRWNAYHHLRGRLSELGVPAETVRFIHEARNDSEKARMFAAARAGQISVLIGSTSKMGVGTNIQPRAIALHHLDCPWRPADIEQRDGRAIRQGNQNPEVQILRYAVERSFDSYSWQTVERKAAFISQVMRGRLDMRSVEDIGDNALSYSEVKALASGDPLILEKAQADADRARLGRLYNAWSRSQQSLRERITGLGDALGAGQRRLTSTRAALAQVTEIRGERFAIVVDDRHTTSRAEAAGLIAQWAQRAAQPPRAPEPRPLGQLAGLPLDGRVVHDVVRGGDVLHVSLRDVPADPASLTLAQLRSDPASIVRQLETRVRDLPALAERLSNRQHQTRESLTQARAALDAPFKHAAELAQATERCQAIARQMAERSNHTPDPVATPREPDARPDSQAGDHPHETHSGPAPARRRYEHDPNARTPGATTRRRV